MSLSDPISESEDEEGPGEASGDPAVAGGLHHNGLGLQPPGPRPLPRLRQRRGLCGRDLGPRHSAPLLPVHVLPLDHGGRAPAPVPPQVRRWCGTYRGVLLSGAHAQLGVPGAGRGRGRAGGRRLLQTRGQEERQHGHLPRQEVT